MYQKQSLLRRHVRTKRRLELRSRQPLYYAPSGSVAESETVFSVLLPVEIECFRGSKHSLVVVGGLVRGKDAGAYRYDLGDIVRDQCKVDVVKLVQVRSKGGEWHGPTRLPKRTSSLPTR